MQRPAYSILEFAPNPFDGERVRVGAIIQIGVDRLVIASDLGAQRLSHADRSLVERGLDELRKGHSFERPIWLGPQFSLTPVRQVPVDHHAEKWVRRELSGVVAHPDDDRGWARQEHSLRIESLRDRPIRLDEVMGAAMAWERFVAVVADENLLHRPSVEPVGTASGSFVLKLSVRVRAIESETLVARMQESAQRAGAPAHRALAELLAPLGVRVDATVSAAALGFSSSFAPTAADTETRAPLLSLEIPQADDLNRVIGYAIERATAPGRAEALAGLSSRQVAYYRHAAWLLGWIDDFAAATPAGRRLAHAPEGARGALATFAFESSRVGEAWIDWSGSKSLLSVDPSSASRFLRESVVGLSAATLTRRSRTLATWHAWLAPRHYAVSAVR